VWILTETLENYKDRSLFPSEVEILSRDYLDKVAKQCQETKGTTVIIYDQTCAAEKRRRRKRGEFPNPAKRVMINQAVCEGCGDCSDQSNCVAVQPVETEYGRKRKINQSACNKDFSCLKGFCPSFVTIEGGELRKTKAGNSFDDVLANIPQPQVMKIDRAYNIMVTGIGGTGVTTIGALLGIAAHMEGKFCRNLDAAGLAQKGGEVLSHVRISPVRDDLRTGHIIAGGADLLLACDMVSAVGKTSYETLNVERTSAVINTENTPVADFVINNDINLNHGQVSSALMGATRVDSQHFVSATSLAMTLLGDEIATNVLMLGFAWQKGLIPVGLKAIERAITLNGVAIEMNLRAFSYGRLAVHDPKKLAELLREILGDNTPVTNEGIDRLDQMIAKRIGYLEDYQNTAYAQRYQHLLDRVIKVENEAMGAAESLSKAVAQSYHKVLAYKDEYEVARLYSNGDFIKELKAQFSGNYKIKLHMAPPILSGTDVATGRPQKRTFGPWMLTSLSLLARLKILRGTVFDVFGYHNDRREERALIKSFEADVEFVIQRLTTGNYELCAELLSLPLMIKGYGPVKAANIEKAKVSHNTIMTRLSL
jgi:indolepyruvate ferredoxin oxidoreductase